MAGKNSWSFIIFSNPTEEEKRRANLYKRMNYIIYNNEYQFNFDDINKKRNELYDYYIHTNGDYKQVFTEDFEKCIKERGEAFACFVMIILMEHIKQDHPTEAKYIKEYLLECPTGEEILKKWDETSRLFTSLPDELELEPCKIFQDAGYLDANYHPKNNLSQTQIAIIANVLADRLNLHPTYRLLGKFWGISEKALSNSYSSRLQKKYAADFETKLQNLLPQKTKHVKFE